MAAESVHTTVRLPADIADAVTVEARRLGVSKGGAIAALIRQGQSLDAGHLLAEITAARYAAQVAAGHAEQAKEAAGRAETAAGEAQQAVEAIPHPPKPPQPAQYTGTAVSWFGAMKVTLSPVRSQAQKGSEEAGRSPSKGKKDGER